MFTTTWTMKKSIISATSSEPIRSMMKLILSNKSPNSQKM
ncbi:hypothetical protein GCK32_018062 [Trichostrongylus colubriformis]|uniref:Uncharacterized protein n=1 Tax=Trichostrongylus colubriformis TaxID=6319 RepID=A0AAN8FDC7_TRICO